MEAVCSSAMLETFFQITWHHKPHDHNMNIHLLYKKLNPKANLWNKILLIISKF
jgi:hypothetical protein